MPQQKTAVIKKLKIGSVDHYNDIMFTFDFDMNGTGCTLIFNNKQVKEMMNDSKVYADVFHLVGLPCEIIIDENNTCHFLGMWKK